MKAVTTFVAAATLATFTASSASAGGFAAVIDETPQIVVPVVEPAGSIPGWVIPAAIAVVLIALATQGGSENTNNYDD